MPVFCDCGRENNAKSLAGLKSRALDEAEFLAGAGATETFGEKGFTTAERMGARPTCEVNGIYGGYMGEGTKTIIPARAGCKITCRLVPDQDPTKVGEAVERHLKEHAPPGVAVEVRRSAGAPAFYMDPDTDWARKDAPALTRGGGSIPVVAAFKRELGLDPLLIGTYAPGERMHSPNERYYPDDFFRAIRTAIALYA